MPTKYLSKKTSNLKITAPPLLIHERYSFLDYYFSYQIVLSIRKDCLEIRSINHLTQYGLSNKVNISSLN